MAVQATEQVKKTPLYEIHVKRGAKMTEFAGYWMPLQYTSMIEEHLAVRQKAGLFDLSHMGEFLVTGEEAESFLEYLITGNPRVLKDGEALYTLFCNEKGGILDDLILYRMRRNRFMLVVNAANIQKDESWISSHLPGGVRCKNASEAVALLALQGPFAEQILRKTPYPQGSNLSRSTFLEIEGDGEKILISRTGYTGEDGFEMYTSIHFAPKLWQILEEAGKDFGLKPAGIGARDILRLEAKLPLYGHELDDQTSPYEAGIGWTVSFQKEDFIGKEALIREKAGCRRTLVGFEMLEQGIPRQGCTIWNIRPHEDAEPDKRIGQVTSGTYSPCLKRTIGLGYVPEDFSEIGTELSVEIRNKKLRARVVKTPFFQKK